MGAYADYTAYRAAIDAPSEWKSLTREDGNDLYQFVQGRSLWGQSAPAAGGAPDRTTTGALGQQNGASELRIVAVTALDYAGYTSGNYSIPHLTLIADRLSHMSGCTWNSASTQTTNLPTPALTRYTSGDGVWAMYENYTASFSSTVPRTYTVSYTNQAGTSGRTSPATVSFITTNSGFDTGDVGLIPLQQGDSGIRSIESFTHSNTVDTGGNVGFTLFKPLLWIPSLPYGETCERDALLMLGAQLPVIQTDACLFAIHFVLDRINGRISNGRIAADLKFHDA